jgi:hypothetical protein
MVFKGLGVLTGKRGLRSSRFDGIRETHPQRLKRLPKVSNGEGRAVLQGAKAVFLKVWLRGTRRETQIPFGNDNKNKDSASEEKAVRVIPSGKLL